VPFSLGNFFVSLEYLGSANRFGTVLAICEAVLQVVPSLALEKERSQKMAVIVVLCLIGIWLIMLAWLFFRQNRAA
jgi:drug/metabolite transporter (DMT)-like permease